MTNKRRKKKEKNKYVLLEMHTDPSLERLYFYDEKRKKIIAIKDGLGKVLRKHLQKKYKTDEFEFYNEDVFRRLRREYFSERKLRIIFPYRKIKNKHKRK